MDAERFDSLVRFLGTPSRRRALRLLAGAAVGGLLAVRAAPLQARRGKKKRKKKRGDGNDSPYRH